jgi:hypothetical protein
MVVQMICNNDFWFAGSVFPRVEYNIPGMDNVSLDTLG